MGSLLNERKICSHFLSILKKNINQIVAIYKIQWLNLSLYLLYFISWSNLKFNHTVFIFSNDWWTLNYFCLCICPKMVFPITLRTGYVDNSCSELMQRHMALKMHWGGAHLLLIYPRIFVLIFIFYIASIFNSFSILRKLRLIR